MITRESESGDPILPLPSCKVFFYLYMKKQKKKLLSLPTTKEKKNYNSFKGIPRRIYIHNTPFPSLAPSKQPPCLFPHPFVLQQSTFTHPPHSLPTNKPTNHSLLSTLVAISLCAGPPQTHTHAGKKSIFICLSCLSSYRSIYLHEGPGILHLSSLSITSSSGFGFTTSILAYIFLTYLPYPTCILRLDNTFPVLPTPPAASFRRGGFFSLIGHRWLMAARMIYACIIILLPEIEIRGERGGGARERERERG